MASGLPRPGFQPIGSSTLAASSSPCGSPLTRSPFVHPRPARRLLPSPVLHKEPRFRCPSSHGRLVTRAVRLTRRQSHPFYPSGRPKEPTFQALPPFGEGQQHEHFIPPVGSMRRAPTRRPGSYEPVGPDAHPLVKVNHTNVAPACNGHASLTFPSTQRSWFRLASVPLTRFISPSFLRP